MSRNANHGFPSSTMPSNKGLSRTRQRNWKVLFETSAARGLHGGGCVAKYTIARAALDARLGRIAAEFHWKTRHLRLCAFQRLRADTC